MMPRSASVASYACSAIRISFCIWDGKMASWFFLSPNISNMFTSPLFKSSLYVMFFILGPILSRSVPSNIKCTHRPLDNKQDWDSLDPHRDVALMRSLYVESYVSSATMTVCP